MILFDISGIFHAKVATILKLNDGEFIVDDFKQSMVGSFATYKDLFSKKYGNSVICLDDDKYWRSAIHPYYKSRRKEKKDNDDIDWKLIYSEYRNFLAEVKTTFPYKMIHVENCEADDIIAVLSQETTEKTVIVSNDKDFIQLINENVDLYSPMKDKITKLDTGEEKISRYNYITKKEIDDYLWEHIIRGDTGDDIPNILSPLDCFHNHIKQKSITKKMLSEWYGLDIKEIAESKEILDRFNLNKKLIDLSMIPDYYKNQILLEFNKPIMGSNKKIQTYLFENGMTNILNKTQLLMEKNDGH